MDRRLQGAVVSVPSNVFAGVLAGQAGVMMLPANQVIKITAGRVIYVRHGNTNDFYEATRKLSDFLNPDFGIIGFQFARHAPERTEVFPAVKPLSL